MDKNNKDLYSILSPILLLARTSCDFILKERFVEKPFFPYFPRMRYHSQSNEKISNRTDHVEKRYIKYNLRLYR